MPKPVRAPLRLEPLSKEYIQKSSIKNRTEQFPEGKWRPVPLTVSKAERRRATVPGKIPHRTAGRYTKRLYYPEASYQKLVYNLVYFAKITAVFPIAKLRTRITVKGSQRPLG